MAFGRRNFSWDWPVRKTSWKSVIHPYPWIFYFSFILCTLRCDFGCFHPSTVLYKDCYQLLANSWHRTLICDAANFFPKSWENSRRHSKYTKMGGREEKQHLGLTALPPQPSQRSRWSAWNKHWFKIKIREAKVENLMLAGQIWPTACFHSVQTQVIFFQQWIQAGH